MSGVAKPKLAVFAVAVAFFVFMLIIFVNSFPADYRIANNDIGKYLSTGSLMPLFHLSSELIGEVGVILRFIGACFFLAATYIFIKRNPISWSFLRKAVLLEGIYYLFNIPFIVYLIVRALTSPDASSAAILSYYGAAASYAAQILFVTPVFLMFYRSLSNSARDRTGIFSWGALAIIGFVFGLWIKHFMLAIYAIGISFSSTIYIVGSINSSLTLLIAALIMVIVFMPLYKKTSTDFNVKALGTAFIVAGLYATIYLAISLVNEQYMTWLSLIDWWTIILVVLGLTVFLRKILKFNADQQMTTVTEELTEKARLRNFGDGVLVITADVVKFYVEKGRFRKHRKSIREIPLAEVENVEQQENDLSIFWKDSKDVFVIANPLQVEPVLQRIMAASKKHTKEVETKTVMDQQGKETTQMAVNALDTSDSLFSILKNLHGRLDWNLIETAFQKVQENVKNLANRPNSLCIDLTQLSAAVHERRPKEISDKTFDVVKALYVHFDDLFSPGENTEQFHLNRQDSQMIMQANYISNDMLLAAVVGDNALEKEGAELIKILDSLPKLPGSKIDTNAIKAELDKLCADKENRVAIVEGMHLMLGQKLREFVIGEQQTLLGSPAALKPE